QLAAMFDEVAVIIVSRGPVIETVFGRQVASQRHGAPFVCAEHHCGRSDKLAVLVHRKPVSALLFCSVPSLHRASYSLFSSAERDAVARALAQCDISTGT